jgi:hypothetical protein
LLQRKILLRHRMKNDEPLHEIGGRPCVQDKENNALRIEFPAKFV